MVWIFALRLVHKKNPSWINSQIDSWAISDKFNVRGILHEPATDMKTGTIQIILTITVTAMSCVGAFADTGPDVPGGTLYASFGKNVRMQQTLQSKKVKVPSSDKGKESNFPNSISGSDTHIRIEGEIGLNFAAQLALEIGKYPDADIELGDSPGGLIDEAILAARILRSQNKTVVAKGSCASACVLLFSGGKTRKMDQSAELGVHRSTWENQGRRLSAEKVQEASGQIGQFYIDMGISPAILVLQLKTPADGMSWIDRTAARAYGFVP